MAQHPHVPKFGNWESGESVPYTAYFDKARKGRGGTKMINPNDPEENPDLHSDEASHAPAPLDRAKAEPEEAIEQGARRPFHEYRRSREDGEFKQFANSPARHDNVGRKVPGDTGQQRHGGRGVGSGETHRRPAKYTGSEQSFERSPLHPQAKISRRSSGSYESNQGTPGRSRLKPATRGDETPDNSAAVPKFGDWDENNPSSADEFTGIFNQVREERQNVAGRVPGIGEPYPKATKPPPASSSSSKSCCFPWSRK